MGNPILHQVATKVEEPGSPEIVTIVDDMLETLKDSGGIGLAAPQVHIAKRIVVFYIPDNRAGENDGLETMTVMLNPEIEPLTEDQELDWEACLSVPGMMGCVLRYTKIRYSWIDLNGASLERIAEGFHARAVQHECDHLDGILYPMRINDFRLFGFSEEIERNPELFHNK